MLQYAVAFCAIYAAAALRVTRLAEPSTVAQVREMIEASPKDVIIQRRGCVSLAFMSQDDRGDVGAFGFGKQIATHWLLEGYGEVLSQALLNILASEKPDWQILEPAQTCLNQIMQTQVQNRGEKAFALHRNSPHLWDAVVGFFKRFRGEPSVLSGKWPIIMFAGLYGSGFAGLDEITEGCDKAGCFELMLDILVTNATKSPALLQAALGALSDNVQYSPYAARAVASHDGVNLLMTALRSIPPDVQYHEDLGFGLRYETLEDIIGILKHDQTGDEE